MTVQIEPPAPKAPTYPTDDCFGKTLSIGSTAALADGTAIPLLGVGTYDIDDGTCEQVVTWALEAGYRHIDTAAFYGNERGVGRAIASSGIPRDELFITTKVWNDKQREHRVRESLEGSLEALGLSRIDLFLLHWPVPDAFCDSWDVLCGAADEGLITSAGVSNFRPDTLAKLIAHAEREGLRIPVVDQMEHHPVMQDGETIAECAGRGIVYEAWSPLGRGSELENPDLSGIAAAHGKSVAQVIIRWDLQHGVVTIPRSVRRERLVENADVFDFALTAKEMRTIDALNTASYYQQIATPGTFRF